MFPKSKSSLGIWEDAVSILHSPGFGYIYIYESLPSARRIRLLQLHQETVRNLLSVV